jgi:LmbE family N-acetylglucosaminyl deacetylase
VGNLSSVGIFTEGRAMNRIMVISPHPDDESIGCGGTILKHVAEGDVVHVELLTSGEKGGHGRSEAETAAVREAEATTAAMVLGLAHVEFYRQPDGALRANKKLALLLAKRINDWRPHAIYVPHPAEQHPDHRIATRLLRQSFYMVDVEEMPRVLAYEVWTPLQQLDEIVDITPYMPRKLSAIAAYKSQTRIMNFEAAALGLARYRGEMHCWPGGEYAEVFADVSKIVCRSLQQQ